MAGRFVAGIVRLGSGTAIFLEREAGYVVVSFLLIMVGVFISDASKRPEIARDLVMYGLGVMSKSMGVKGLGKQS